MYSYILINFLCSQDVAENYRCFNADLYSLPICIFTTTVFVEFGCDDDTTCVGNIGLLYTYETSRTEIGPRKFSVILREAY